MLEFRHPDLLTPGSDTGWFKSSHSGTTEACLEVRPGDGLLLVRDSKDGRSGATTQPNIAIPADDWPSFLDAARSSLAWQTPDLELTITQDGSSVLACTRSGVQLAFTPPEWAAFVAAAADGHFDLISR